MHLPAHIVTPCVSSQLSRWIPRSCACIPCVGRRPKDNLPALRLSLGPRLAQSKLLRQDDERRKDRIQGREGRARQKLYERHPVG